MPGSRYDASTRTKAVRLVREHAGDYPTQWAAIRAVSGRLGMSSETLAALPAELHRPGLAAW
jgi:transposase